MEIISGVLIVVAAMLFALAGLTAWTDATFGDPVSARAVAWFTFGKLH